METITIEKTSEFEAPVMDVIRERRSRRAYLPTAIDPEKIKSLFEAAKWAPSSMNDQPWKYIYATKEQPELWNKLHSLLNEGNRPWTEQAPLLILSLARTRFMNYGTHNPTALYDLGAANAFMSLQATELGLNIHQMGGYNREKARALFNISDEYELGVLMAVGYPGEPDQLPENLRLREEAPRVRYAQKEFVMDRVFE